MGTSPFYLTAVLVPAASLANTTATATTASGVDDSTPGVNPTGNILSSDTDTVETVQIQVWLTAGSDAEAVDLGLGYNTALGTYVSASGPTGWESLANQVTPGTILLSGFDPSFVAPIATGSDSLVATFNFTPATSATDFAATLTSADFTDVNNTTTTPSLPGTLTVPFPGLTVTGVAAGTGTDDTAGTVGNPLAGAYGTLTLNANGSYQYVVNQTDPAVQALNVGQSLTDTFTYTVTDVVPQTATLTVTIDGENNGALCFCKGTLIATPTGEVPVERLLVGDLVLTLRGETQRIIWMGAGRVLATRGRRNAATPVIVRKGALADNVPHHDLHVTKGHAFYLDNVLVPVEFLVNHRSIIWDDRAQEVELYHVELASHDVLLANGAPAESYRDDGNRWLFQNANSGWGLPPQEPCAPVLTGGPIVDAVWRRLLDRAGPRPGLMLTEDPDLHVLVSGERVDAASRHGAAHIFYLPAGRPLVRVVSRAGSPAELGVARDPRVLGVAVTRIALRQGRRFRIMEAADPALVDGFHTFEPDNGLRWTDGDAGLPAPLFEGFEGPIELVLHLGGSTQYPLLGEAVVRAAA